MKSFLFLQGPHGNFFRELGHQLLQKGHTIHRVNLCGGDWLDWHDKHAVCYRKKPYKWGKWIGDFMQKKKITDLLIFGDWRSLHQEAIAIAQVYNIRVWAFEEGYMRPSYITMEKNGVNGNSSLPKTFKELETCFNNIRHDDIALCEPVSLPNPISVRMTLAFNYSATELLARPFFPWYKTHRPNGILKELTAWIFRLPKKHVRRRDAINNMRKVYHSHKSYFLFPLQLDSDSQVRRYSPFGGVKEAIIYVISSFAIHAPKDTLLVIRNHPLDNGMINYKDFIRNFAFGCGVSERVFFVETGNARLMLEKSNAVVVLNSTIGMSALRKGLPVYCVGTSIYSIPGLAVNKNQQRLEDFWNNPIMPQLEVLQKFETVVKHHALINGNFYSKEGIEFCLSECCERLE